MTRSCEPELLDVERLPEPVVERAYRDLTWLHRVLGNTRHVARAIRRDPLPVRCFGTFTSDLEALAEWLQQCGVET